MSVISRFLPLSSSLSRRGRLLLVGGFCVLVTLLVCIAAEAVMHLGERADRHSDWLCAPAFVAVAALCWLRVGTVQTDRRAWAMLATTMSLSAAAWSLWLLWLSHLPRPAIPSLSDALWLADYPFLFAAIGLLARASIRRQRSTGVWLDGVIAGAGMAGVGAALLLPPALSTASGTPLAVVTELSYPVIDMILLAFMAGVVVLRGWRLDRMWAVLIAGFVLGVGSDFVLAASAANGANGYGQVTDLLYVLQAALLALAAWQPRREAPAAVRHHWSMPLLPISFTVGSIGLLIYNQYARLPLAAFVLAITALFAATARMALAFREMIALAEAKRQASTDELTELPNRRMFMRRLDRAIDVARSTGEAVSVLVLDLNNFKQLNDTLGHDAGDELLRLIGPRLAACLNSADTVARLGGDEFAILIDRPLDSGEFAALAPDLLSCVRAPFEVQGLALRLTASVGVASFPEHAADSRELLKRADVAMYLAKASRRGWELYASDRDTNSREQLVMASDLAIALERGGIVAHFQPIADAQSRAIVGAEALVRWRRADGTLLPPNEFISAAEHSGLSRPLTRRMLMLALEQVAGWRAAGHELYVAINATVADLLDANFPEEIGAALDLYGVPAHALVVEVTESSILADPCRIELVLAGLRDLGVGLALDDFGTGYSSLAHLRTLTVQQVKIDRSFVTTMCTEKADAAIVHATIGLAHELGLRVVAEGVEDEPTWQALAKLGCERIQGYGLGRPMGPAEFQRLIGTRAPSAPILI